MTNDFIANPHYIARARLSTYESLIIELGLPWTPDYHERMEYIRIALIRSNYDLIILQELFMSNDIDRFCTSLSDTFPFIHYFYSGFVGSGVMFLSKYRMKDLVSIPYAQSGIVYHTGGDWFARKSICYAKVAYQDKLIHVFGTHTHAKYLKNDYKAVRTLQLYHLARMIKIFTKSNDAVIVAGDLNSEFHEIGMKYLIDRCDLVDPYYSFHDDNSLIYTCNDQTNKYSSKRDKSCRIDYIFHTKHFKPVEYNIVFKKVPSKEIFYSDHSGVEVDLEYSNNTVTSATNQEALAEDLYSIKSIIQEGYNESIYSFRKNSLLGVLIFVAYRLLTVVWITAMPGNTILDLITPVFYTALLLIWIFSNFTTCLSIKSQQRAYLGTIKEIDIDLILLSQ